MAAKKYSAGAIFLQVVPVFANVQRAIEDEAKNIDRALGDTMEKSGEKAGQRAGKAASKSMNEEIEKGSKDASGSFEREFNKSIDGINKSLGGIDIKRLGNGMRTEVTQIKKELDGLKGVDLTVEADFKRAYAEIAVLEGRLRGVRDEVKIVFRSDIDDAMKGFAKVAAIKESISDPVEIEVRADARKMGAFERSIKSTMRKISAEIDGSANKSVRNLNAELVRLGNLNVGVDIGAKQMRAEIAVIMRELNALSQNSPDIDVRFEAGRAWAEYKAFDMALDRMDGRNVNIKVDTKQAQSNLFGLTRGGDDASNSFRSFNIILLAAAGIGPALIPVLGAIAGGLLAIGPAAGVAAFGLSSVLIGFSGVGDAVTALQAKQDQGALSGQVAARAQASNAQAVADARRSAADQIESALERQKDAQEAYKDSIDEVRDAEKALRDAREAAKGTGRDIDQRVRGNSLAIDQALLDEFSSTSNFNAVMSDGSSTNAEQEQARIDMEETRLRMEELRDEQKELAAEKKKWDKDGVNGTEEVQSAQDQLSQAIDAQRDAYENLRDSAEAVDQARADGARQVTRALQGQSDAMEQVNTQQNAIDTAFDKLGPAGRKFAIFIQGLKDGFYSFRDDIQTVLLPQVQFAIESFFGSDSGKVLREALIGLADSFGAFTIALSASFQGEAWTGFFTMLRDLGPEIQGAWADAFILFLEAMASLMTTLAPFALDFAEGLAAMMESFAGWAGSKEGADGIEKFMGYVEEVAPKVLEFIGAFAGAMTNLLVALAPYGSLVLDGLIFLLDTIANMDPKVLGAILTAVLVLLTASQLAYLSLNLLNAGTALISSALSLTVFFVVGLAIAFVLLYNNSETFRAFIDGPFGKALIALSAGILAVVVALKIYRVTMAIAAAIQTGFAASTYGSAGATYALTTAQRLGYIAGRAYAAGVAVMTAVTNLLSLSMLRQRIATVALWVSLQAYSWGARIAAAATLLFSGALLANPIGLIVLAIIGLVAVIVILWKNHEGFRDIVLKVWEKVKSAFWSAWETIKEVFDAIGAAMVWLWKKVLSPALSWLAGAFGTAFKYIKLAWTNILWPVFKMIVKVIWTVWKTYIKVVLTLIMVIFKVVFLAIKFLWQNVLWPIFKLIGKVIGLLWKYYFKPNMEFIAAIFKKVFTGMKWVWENVLKPVFDFIVDKALPKLKGAFQIAVDAIKSLWDGLKKIVGAPIKFVLDTIINKGLIGGFNKVAGWVGMKGFDTIPIPSALQSYATGGVMPGYTPGRDVHQFTSPTAGRLELSGGESIMRPEWTQAIGAENVHKMNSIARSGGVSGVRKTLGGYYLGGILPLMGGSVVAHTPGQYPGYAADMNYPGYADYGEPVKAWKSGLVAQQNYVGDQSYGRWTVLNHGAQSSLYAHLSGFGKLNVGDKVRAGQTVGYVGDLGNTGTPPTSHLHFEVNGGSVGYADSAGQAEAGGGRSIPKWLMSLAKDPLGAVKNWVTSGVSKASDLISSSPVFDAVTKMPLLAAKRVTDKVWDVVPGWVKSTAGWAGDAAGWAVGGVKGAAGAAADVAGGVAGGIADGAGAVGNFLGFAEGGILPYNGTMKYDNGGYLPPGLTSVVNLTGRPEPVFTNDQFSNMENGGGGGNINYSPVFNASDLTSEDVAGDLNFTFRRIRRAGKYEGVGS